MHRLQQMPLAPLSSVDRSASGEVVRLTRRQSPRRRDAASSGHRPTHYRESALMSVWAWSKLVGVVRLTVSETVDPKQSSGPMVLTITTSQTRRSVCICGCPN
jgi:hypothetical protein